ncbi:FKBP-type peptidyl-prolyl cis-trans isomerase [Candidatus Bathyarchaeota archaeon]|nr:FKBP-type peptidyl-prolyl cis-trans isomerase [Candidatus Bathyarchaeota archaeon]
MSVDDKKDLKEEESEKAEAAPEEKPKKATKKKTTKKTASKAKKEEPKKKAAKKVTTKKTASKAKKAEPKKKAAKKKEPVVEPVKEGDFLLLEMTGKAVETGEVFDTTDEELAKVEGIYDENRTYGPRLVVVGESYVLKGLDDKLPGLKLEESAEVEIPPEDAFGERNLDNVRTLPFRMLRSKGVNPVVGQQVEMDGRTAQVRSVGAGRVQLDYNHPLAGRKIVYEVKPASRYEGEEEKIRALIGRRFFGIDLALFKIKLLKKKVRIEIPEEIFFGENIQIAKRGVAMDIHRYFEDVDEIEYNEIIKRS